MTLVMMNLIIAILSESYENTNDKAEGYKYKEKLDVMRRY